MFRFVYIVLSLVLLFKSATIHGLQMGSQLKKIVILLGPPGSGKGTQAKRLSRELNIPHISTGDLFRENMSRNTELGKKAKGYIEAGQLVPDELVLDMLFERVSKPDAKYGVLLDGFPRTIPQAEAFDAKLCGNERLIVLNLQVPDRVIEERAAARLSCPNCGCVYNRNEKGNEGKCDQCDAGLVRRPDDAPEVVQERLRVYSRQTAPLIDFYAKKGVLYNVNGNNPPDQVFQDLMQRLQNAG